MTNRISPNLTPIPSHYIVLDIGNVCLKVEFDRFLYAIGFNSEEEFRQSDRGRKILELAVAVEEGRISPDFFLDQLVRLQLFPSSSWEEAEHLWSLIIGEELPMIGDYVFSLHQLGIKFIFLSDICPLHFAIVKERLSFFHLVEYKVLSYEVGALKPHSKMFETVETILPPGVRPLIYADDKLENVQAASQRGWKVHHFTEPFRFIETCNQLLSRNLR